MWVKQIHALQILLQVFTVLRRQIALEHVGNFGAVVKNHAGTINVNNLTKRIRQGPEKVGLPRFWG